MKKFLTTLFLSFIFVVNIDCICFAVSANPELIEIKQPDGKKIKIRVKGDEFYNWVEDKDGYTVIKDTVTKVWSYAKKDNKGSLKPSENIVGKANPFSLNITKRLKDDSKFNKAKENRKKFNEQLKNKFNSLSSLKISSSESKSLSQVQQVGSISDIKEVKGTRKNFVLLIQFSDLAFADNPPFTDSTEAEIKQAFYDLFNKTGYSKDGAVGSVKDYFNEVSYGNLNYESVISPVITLNFSDATKNSSDYYAYYNGSDLSFRRTREMIKQALKQLHDSGFDFKTVWPNATEPEGFTVIHAGGGAESGNYDFIWSHQWNFESFPQIKYDGIKFTDYHVEPAGRGYYGKSGLTRIGVICHESIHFFGIPDLYDTSEQSEGLGKFCVMAYGSWNGSDGKRPAHPCPWIKYKLGWMEPKTASEGINYIAQSETPKKEYDRFYMFAPFSYKGEYFLIENKQSVGFDREVPGSKKGLLIYHIDERMDDNNLGHNAHYLVDIEEADGTSDWTQDHLAVRANKGVDADYYRSGTVTVFNDSCVNSPNSKSYSGASSGIDIYGISSTGSTMYFYLPTVESFENFVDNLDSTGLALVNVIMKYNPEKTISDLRNLNASQQKLLAQYFELSTSGAREANTMGTIYFDYVDNGLVYGIGKNKTGVVTNVQANYILKLNSILTKSQQEITSVGNISEQNESPLNNLTVFPVSSSSKRFTGTDAVSSIEGYVEEWGCLIYTFSKMKYQTGYDIVEVTKATNLDDYPNYSLVKGKNSEYFSGLSNVVVYPNPAKQGVVNFINLPTETKDLNIEIYTITGQFVKSFNLSDTSVIVTGNRKLSWKCKNYSGSSVAPGVYVALIKSNSDKRKIKFAIVR